MSLEFVKGLKLGDDEDELLLKDFFDVVQPLQIESKKKVRQELQTKELRNFRPEAKCTGEMIESLKKGKEQKNL